MTDIKKLMKLDMEAGEPPAPKNLSQIFKAALVSGEIETDFLRDYLHSIQPGLDDLSRAFQHLAEENRESISTEALETISRGLELMLLPDTNMPDHDTEEIYDSIVDLLEDSSQDGNLEKYLLNALLILAGSLLTAAAIPHIIRNHENYSEQAKNFFNWLRSLFPEN